MSDGFDSQRFPDLSPPDSSNPYAAPAEVGIVAADAHGELATRSARFAGAFVDGLLMIPVIAVVIPIGMRIGVEFQDNALAAQLLGGLVGMLTGSLWYLILNGYTLANRGQTLGKIAAGTKIVDAQTGEILPLMPLFFKRFFSIQVISLIPIVGNLFGLVDSLMIFRENRRCLHDDFAGTKVINVRK